MFADGLFNWEYEIAHHKLKWPQDCQTVYAEWLGAHAKRPLLLNEKTPEGKTHPAFLND